MLGVPQLCDNAYPTNWEPNGSLSKISETYPQRMVCLGFPNFETILGVRFNGYPGFRGHCSGKEATIPVVGSSF